MKHRPRIFIAIALAAKVWTAQGALAQTEPADTDPLWELGIGAFGLIAPDYPASGESSFNGLALPYGIYRGEVIRVDDEDGARVVPFDTPAYEISLSAGAAFGAQSEGRGVREGMPDLDPLLELGPQVIFRGPDFGPASRRGRIDFALQARVVASLDFNTGSAKYRGMVFEPEVEARWPDAFGAGTEIRASVGPVFATEALQAYFYEVEPKFARAGRPTYQSQGGYLGTDVVVSLSYDLTPRFTAFGGMSASSHAGAANRSSPLFEQELNGAAFFGIAVILAESQRRVKKRY
ncbi:MipA/OmpV family protein (plasmid) [Rhodobacteraceae bacterium SC52]|nr:MipA/OmpV family protein [Rhodobacteraceae bacterium SC52]